MKESSATEPLVTRLACPGTLLVLKPRLCFVVETTKCKSSLSGALTCVSPPDTSSSPVKYEGYISRLLPCITTIALYNKLTLAYH